VQDLDRQVVPVLAEEVLGLLHEDHAGPVVRIDDVVADLEGALDGGKVVVDLYRFVGS
jgi:hypothetical protein